MFTSVSREGAASDFTSAAEHAAFLDIVAAVLQRTGVDFSRYRAATVRRRIENRMGSVGFSSFGDYRRYLDGAQGEDLQLLDRLTIKVSSFYRNPGACDALREHVLSRLAALRMSRAVRIWSVGCGRGEEPYTLAMLLESAGMAGEVLATDIAPAALAIARRAEYGDGVATGLPSDITGRYLHAVGAADSGRFRVSEAVCRRVRFSHHDATSPALPPGEEVFDLICCRNLLIYFTPQQQVRTLALLRQALAHDGFLWLGEAEWPPPAVAAQFIPLNAGARIFVAAGPAQGDPA